MGSAYTIFGRTIQPHVLAIATIASTVGVAAYSMSGSKAEAAPQPASAKSTQESGDLDVEKLIDNYLKQSEKN
ncbi:hypothetical protein ACU8KH_04736 [Lachancea thermotolerans]